MASRVQAASQTLGWGDPLKEKIEQSLSDQPETCLFTACVFGFLEVFEEVVSLEPAILKQANSKGATTLHLACQYGHIDITKLLFAQKIDIDAIDQDKKTALVRAAASGHEEIVRLLMNCKATRTIRGSRFWGPLQAACLRGHI